MLDDIVVDESLLAHINADPFLSGSHQLEGQDFKKTSQYLNLYLKQLPSARLTDKLLQLQQACDALIAIQSELCLIDELNDEQKLAGLINSTIEKIAQLKPQQYLLLPGGWRSANSSHAMLYKITKHDDGKLYFTIINTGSGIKYHQTIENEQGIFYNPNKIYELPRLENIGQQHLKDFLEQLFKQRLPSIHNASAINANYLYQKVMPSIAFIDGKLINDEKENKTTFFTKGQLAGTCAQRCLHQLIKQQFDSIDDYRKFIFNFKLSALDKHWQYLIDNDLLSQSKRHPLLIKIIRRQLRILNRYSEENPETFLFDDDTKIKILTKLLDYQKQLTAITKTQQSAPTAPRPVISKETIHLPPLELQPPQLVANQKETPAADYAIKIIEVTDGAELPQQLSNILSHCQQLLNRQQAKTVILQLEHLFNQLPLPDNAIYQPLMPFYLSAVKGDSIEGFLETCNSLQALYFKSYDAVYGSSISTPQLYITKCSIFALFSHLLANLPFISDNKAFDSFINANLYAVMVSAKDSPLLNSENHQLNQRLLHLQRLYQSAKRFNMMSSVDFDSLTKYYQHIINQQPELKAKLQSLYEKDFSDEQTSLHQALREQHLETLYYYLENEHQLPDEFAPLKKQFDCHFLIEKIISDKMHRLNQEYHNDNQTTQHAKITIEKQRLVIDSLFLKNQCAIRVGKSLINYHGDSQHADVNAALVSSLPQRSYDELTTYLDNQAVLKQNIYGESIASSSAFTELTLLRQVPSSQIVLTLEYFINQPQLLANKSYQDYLFKNLFQASALKDNEQRLSISTIIKKANQLYSKLTSQKPQQAEQILFAISLLTRLYLYFNDVQANHYRSELLKCGKSMAGQLDFSSATPCQWQYALLAIKALLSQTPRILSQHKNIQLLIRLWLFCKLHSQRLELSGQQLVDFQQLEIALSTQLKNIGSLGQGLIIDTIDLPHFQPHQKALSLTGNHPYYLLTNQENTTVATINIDHGTVDINGKRLDKIPSIIVNHPLLKSFKELTINEQSKHRYLVESDQAIMLFVMNNHQLQIYRKWPDKNSTQWHELVPFSKQQCQSQQLQPFHFYDLPFNQYIKQDNHQLWLAEDKAHAVIACDNDILYQGKKSADGFIFEDDSNNVLTDLNSPLYQLIEDFEDKQFVSITTHHQQASILLHRYQKTLEYNKQGLQLLHHSERYYHDPSLFQLDGVSSLSFKHDNKAVCLIPMQPFLATEHRQAHSELVQLKQDIHFESGLQLMKKVAGNVDIGIWDETFRETLLCYELTDGKLVSHNAIESLYLCYLYLATNQVELAWQELDKYQAINGSARLTPEHLRCFYYLITALPLELDTQQKSHQYQTPDFICCQLKALAMLSDQLHNKPIIQTPLETTGLSKHAKAYQLKRHQQANEFLDKIHFYIYQLYQRYQTMSRELSAGFSLSDKDKYQLLQSYHQALPSYNAENKAMGAMGFEWQQLQLKKIKQQLSQLANKEALTKVDHALLSGYLHQLETINQVQTSSGELEYVPIHFELDELEDMPNYHLAEQTRAMINAANHPLAILDFSADEKRKAIDALTMSITDEQYHQYFAQLLSIATNHQDPHHSTLKSFCYAYLVSNKAQSQMTASSNSLILSYLLYQLSCHPQLWPAAINGINELDSYQKLIAFVKKLPPLTISIAQYADKTAPLMKSLKSLYHQLTFEKPLTLTYRGKQDLQSIINNQSHFLPLLAKQKDHWLALYDDYLAINNASNSSLSDKEIGNKRYQSLKALQSLSQSLLSQPRLQRLDDQITQHVKLNLENIQRTQELITKRLSDSHHFKGNINTLAPLIALHANQSQSFSFEQFIEHALEQTDLKAFNDILSETEKQNLIDIYFEYIAYQILQNHLHALKKQLTLCLRSPSTSNLCHLLSLLYSHDSNTLADSLPMAIFSLKQKIRLRAAQQPIIERLRPSENGDTIERVVMGGGKSKVILPLLAFYHADGQQLVMIEVPDNLLHSSYAHFKQMAKSTFNQECHLFTFNRSSPATAQAFKDWLALFEHARINKEFIITTAASIQSLELKYIELLEKHQLPYTNNQQALKWLGQLLLLLRQHGKGFIDEVHDNLHIKNKVNYTLGQSLPLATPTIEQTIQLYQFFQKVIINAKDSQCSLLEMIQDKKHRSQLLALDITEVVAKDLISHSDSPISHLVKRLSVNEKAQLLEYLTSPKPNSQRLTSLFSELDIEALNSLRLQVSHFLPQTLKKHHLEHYGPSQNQSLAIAERLLNIPYQASDKPRERAKFGNPIETLNYTIQSLLINGLSLELFKDYLLAEVSPLQLQQLDGQQSGRQLKSKLRLLCQQLAIDEDSLLALNANNHLLIEQLFLKHQYNPWLIFQVLEKSILPHLKMNPTIISSDPFNHVEMYKQVIGFSGTPYNQQTYHPKLNYQANHTAGLDPLIDTAISDKLNTIIAYQANSDLDDFLANLFDHTDLAKLHAVIDVNATFAGTTAKVVAKTIASVISNRPELDPQLKYILYFDEHDALMALAINQPELPAIALRQTSLEHIQQKLGCSADGYITFFDQAHSLGADVPQAENGMALMLIDEATTISNFHQGCLRMRSLIEGEQSITIAAPPSIAPLGYQQLSDKMLANQQQQVDKSLSNMDYIKNRNSNRNAAFEEILLTHDIDGKKQLLSKHRNCFIEDIAHQSDNIQTLNTEIETEQELAVSVELEYQTQQQAIKHQAAPFISCVTDDGFHPPLPLSLNDILSNSETQYKIFDKNISASQNFYKAHQNQTAFFDSYLKPAFCSLFYYQDEQLKCQLLSQQEVQELKDKPSLLRQMGGWITTEQGSVIAGRKRVKKECQVCYSVMMQQIRLFNGNLSALLSEPLSLNWLMPALGSNFDLFISQLRPIRQLSSLQLDALQARVEQYQQAQSFISQHQETDLSWQALQKRYPLLTKADSQTLINEAEPITLTASLTV